MPPYPYNLRDFSYSEEEKSAGNFRLALYQTSLFLVVDRGGPGENCEQLPIGDGVSIAAL